MDNPWVIRGVPDGIARDAWWLTDEVSEPTVPRPDEDAHTRHLSPKAIAALAVLILLADGLFWDVDLGISIAFYALVLSACILAMRPGGVTRREAAIAMSLTLVCNLPAIEQVQPLSLGFSGAGVVMILAWVTLEPRTGMWQAFVLFTQASFVGPLALPFDAADDLRGVRSGVDVRAWARAVALPLGIGAVFLVLFIYANPLVETALTRVTSIEVFTPAQLSRATFWGLSACFLWPYLTPQGRWRMGTGPAGGSFTMPTSPLINAGSVRTSLIVFNVMFAVQTLSDLGILTGGLALPEGMSYAQYAHRGAYSLVITALLSGAFAVATHRMVAESHVLKILMYIWLGQNLFLVLTATVRLGLYVDAYTLTYLRVAAFIWFGLVAVTLALIIVQIARERPLSWLIRSCVFAVAGTLYLCCFMNFAYVITSYNMAHTTPEALDLEYLCRLGEQVIPAMMDYGQITDQTVCGRDGLASIRFDPMQDWQEWGFRRWRLQRYLETYHDL